MLILGYICFNVPKMKRIKNKLKTILYLRKDYIQ